MRRSVVWVAVAVVSAAAVLAGRSPDRAPPSSVANVAPVTEEGDSPAFDHTSWYVARSHTTASRTNAPRATRPATRATEANKTAAADGASETKDAPNTRAPKPGPAPRASGTSDEFLSDALFRRLDEDNDGVLRSSEIPTALRAKIGSRVTAITPERFTALFVEAVAARRTSDLAAATPAWFTELDSERRGHVSRRAWQNAGRDDDAFERMDADGDGFVSQREAVAFATQSGTTTGPSATAPARPTQFAPTAGGAGASTASEEKPKTKADALFDHYTATATAQLPVLRGSAAATFVTAAKKPVAAPTPPPPPAKPAPKSPAGPQATLPEPIAGHPYWVQRNNENIAALAAGARPDVLFLGDSITDFLGRGYGKPLWDEVYAPLTGLNFGIGGITTSHVLWQVETGQVALANPKTIVLLIGSNNLGAAQRPNEVAAGVEKIVSTIAAQLPDTKVMVVGILPRGFLATDPFRDTIPETNRLIADAVGDRTAYTDVGSVFLSPDNSISPDLMPDGAHPSLYGYKLYTDAIWPTLTSVTPKK